MTESSIWCPIRSRAGWQGRYKASVRVNDMAVPDLAQNSSVTERQE